jgi:hypothetical protein
MLTTSDASSPSRNPIRKFANIASPWFASAVDLDD